MDKRRDGNAQLTLSPCECPLFAQRALTKRRKDFDHEAVINKEENVFALWRTPQTGVRKMMPRADSSGSLLPHLIMKMRLVIGGINDDREFHVRSRQLL